MLYAVQSAVTATAELLVINYKMHQLF